MIPVDERGWSPFRAAIESKDFDRVVETLAPDVHFRSPVVFAPYEGREPVAFLLGAVGQVLGPSFAYRWQVQEGEREVLFFTSRVGDRDVEGVDLVGYGDDGLVSELVVMLRPLSALVAVRDAVGRVVASG